MGSHTGVGFRKSLWRFNKNLTYNLIEIYAIILSSSTQITIEFMYLY